MQDIAQLLDTKPDSNSIDDIYKSFKLYVTKDQIADIYHKLSEKAPFDQYIQTKDKLRNLDKSVGQSIAELQDKSAEDRQVFDQFQTKTNERLKKLNTDLYEMK